ncbi:MAG TPA: histone deacetylase [Candidatus Saccharimonadia bacterium]|nr:histone deacetylase [Candidatus Saccharimonadia bacterium]
MRVVYGPEQLAPAQGYSPSAAKPGPVVAAWRRIDATLELVPPRPVSIDELALAHARDYVEAVLDLRVPNGFGTIDAGVARSLPYTSGAMLTAARLALRDRRIVAAPVSGFHHAGWDHGGGFCTFNGLMVTARVLLAERAVQRIGILDYDYHYGDGTNDILRTLGGEGVVHYTAGAEYDHPAQAEEFLAAIERHLELMASCELVLYQAGADPHVDDPLGGFLTTAQLALRDERVFDGLRRRGIAVAWNLAGGYQSPLEKVIRIHENTYRAACAPD